MTGSTPPPTGVQELAVLGPPIPVLSSLSTTIESAVSQYESAKSPEEKALALRYIQAASTKLSRMTTPIPQQFIELNLRPNVNVAVRIAVEMRLFHALATSGEPVPVTTLAEKINAQPEFVLRISRALAAFDLVEETYASSGMQQYNHTPLSRLLVMPAAEAVTRHLFDDMLQAQVVSAGRYYVQNGFKNPTDAKNCPFTFSHGVKDADFFQILETMPDRMAIFNTAMTITAVGLKEVGSLYPFNELQQNAEGVALVDVGGGKGHVTKDILASHSQMQGKVVLQDLKSVLDGGTVVAEHENVVLQPYDFLKEIQPVKGECIIMDDIGLRSEAADKISGANYFFKSIFHDWPDKDCLKILENLVPAVKGHSHSRLLICDLVLPDRAPDTDKVLRDLNMLVIGGKERSLSQWSSLLGQAGFKIVKVHGEDMPNSSIIEAAFDQYLLK
jgi:O-methyltransferase domain